MVEYGSRGEFDVQGLVETNVKQLELENEQILKENLEDDLDFTDEFMFVSEDVEKGIIEVGIYEELSYSYFEYEKNKEKLDRVLEIVKLSENDEIDEVDELKLLKGEEPEEEIEVDRLEFKLDNEDNKNIVKMQIPILWVPCKDLESYLKTDDKITKQIFLKHYVTCINCEFNNNNRNINKDINNKNIKIYLKKKDDEEEMNEIIKYYKNCKNYVISKKDIKKYDYQIEHTLIFCYNNSEEKIYNHCIFILKTQ